MKTWVYALVFVAASSALADQTIFCREVTSRGAVKRNGGRVEIELVSNRNGRPSTSRSIVTLDGFTRDPESLGEVRLASVGQSAKNARHAYTTFFLASETEPLDIQLQFRTRVVNSSFRDLPAKLVIGSEDANPEAGFAFGFSLICDSQVR